VRTNRYIDDIKGVVLGKWKTTDGGLRYNCALMGKGEVPEILPMQSVTQRTEFNFEVPTNGLFRAQIRPIEPGVDVSGPYELHVIRLRTFNAPGEVELTEIRSGVDAPLIGDGIDAAVYNLDGVMGCPVDVGLVSDDRRLEIGFRAIRNETQRLVLRISYNIIPKNPPSK
jgi:hypothetical protein